MADDPDPANPSGWKFRRRLNFGTVIFCFAGVAYILITRMNDELGRLALPALVALIGTTVAGYTIMPTIEKKKGDA